MYNSGLYVYFESGGIKTADNGLTATGTNVQLGGALLQNTVIDIEGFTLAANMSGAGKDLQVWDGVNRINTFYQTVRFDPTDFGLNVNDLIGFNATGDAYQLTASNGLTVTAASPGTNRLKLGGTLLEDTVIEGSGTYNFTINNANVFQINTQPSGPTLNTNIIFDITANSASQQNRFELKDISGSSNSEAQFYINKPGTSTMIACNRNNGAGIINFDSGNFFQTILKTTNTYNLLGFGSNTAASPINHYILLSGGNSARTYTQYLNFVSGVAKYGNLNVTNWTPSGTDLYTRFHAGGSWQYFNRSANLPIAAVNGFTFYSADIIGGDACPHFETEDNKTIILYPFNVYGAPTGTATRTTFNTATVTLSDLAERVKALIDDLQQNGIIG